MGPHVNPLGAALFARHALLADGWRRDVLIAWDGAGDLVRVEPDAVAEAGSAQANYVLPGMINLHSHAFQRALGGLTERAGGAGNGDPDSFWTWRDLMYRVANRLTPEQMEAVAAQLYAECLRHGYTAVCEFHYLQHGPGGAPYHDRGQGRHEQRQQRLGRRRDLRDEHWCGHGEERGTGGRRWRRGGVARGLGLGQKTQWRI